MIDATMERACSVYQIATAYSSKNKRFVFGSFSQTHAVVSGQRNFHTNFRKCPPHSNCIARWVRQWVPWVFPCSDRPQTPHDAVEIKTVPGLMTMSGGKSKSEFTTVQTCKTALNRNSAIYKEGMLQSVCAELEYRLGICRVTNDTNIEQFQ